MAKIDPLTTITSGFNSTAQLNSNFTKITDALNNTLSRDGSLPNNMDAVLDMNSNRIINVTDPVDNQDVVTKTFLQDFTSGSIDIAAAAASAAAALVSETNAATSETNAAASANSQIRFAFATSTTMADPGVGNFRMDNATPSSVTAIAFDATMNQTGNPDISDYLATWDDSTSSVTGQLTLIKGGEPETFALFNVTAVADNTGWLEITVTHVASSGTFSAADNVDTFFARSGDIGATGGGLADIVDDITPQLGGNLDVNGQSIISVSDGDIPITPNGTGDVIIDGLKWPQADGSANQFIKTNGSGQLSFSSIFTPDFTSSEIAVTSGGVGSAAHSLGAIPSYFTFIFRCKTAEFGYAIGDELTAGTIFDVNTAATNRGVSVYADVTNVNFAFGDDTNPLKALDATDGSAATLTNANWKLEIKVWA